MKYIIGAPLLVVGVVVFILGLSRYSGDAEVALGCFGLIAFLVGGMLMLDAYVAKNAARRPPR